MLHRWHCSLRIGASEYTGHFTLERAAVGTSGRAAGWSALKFRFSEIWGEGVGVVASRSPNGSLDGTRRSR